MVTNRLSTTVLSLGYKIHCGTYKVAITSKIAISKVLLTLYLGVVNLSMRAVK
ncbi:hypothetical protein Golax_005647 [Gossypium laxum]|uniref:Uncharacterized protein n=1 Tax=Gossypium laxum TaxID=34288 RepID=A0A7J9A2U3_9ROSI|nr:hypothetical protein [Gossypium laxum]